MDGAEYRMFEEGFDEIVKAIRELTKAIDRLAEKVERHP